jgi:hypothetical protein
MKKVSCHKCAHRNHDMLDSFTIMRACHKKDDAGNYKYKSLIKMNRDYNCPDFKKQKNSFVKFFKRLLKNI